MVFGPKARIDSGSDMFSQSLQCIHEARNLGLTFDLDLNFFEHFSNINKSVICQIR